MNVDMLKNESIKLYHELASWWPLLSPPSEYAEEAAIYQKLLEHASKVPARTLLELGSGGGNNASFLKAHFQITLVDCSAAMLEVSRALNPECEHIEGDMRHVRLDRTFDCVFIHDAIEYIISESDLRKTLETAFMHCRPGGSALFAPDFVRETFKPITDHGGYDGQNRSMRYLEWVWDPDPSDTTYIADLVYMMRENDGSIHVEKDRHLQGLFAREDWLGLLAEVGFRADVQPVKLTQPDEHDYEVFVCRRNFQ